MRWKSEDIRVVSKEEAELKSSNSDVFDVWQPGQRAGSVSSSARQGQGERHSVSTCQTVSANQSKGPCKIELKGSWE